MATLNRTTARRKFLGTLAAGTAATLGLAGLTTATPPEALASTLYRPGDDTGFEAWLGKIKGSHKQVFDTPMPNGGMTFAWSRVFLMTNAQFGAAENDVTAVIVLRHDAIPYGMDHNLWTKYKLGENFHIEDAATKAPALRNPQYQPKPGEQPLPDMGIEHLTQSGVLIGICDIALSVYSAKLAKNFNMDAADIKKDWVAGLVPGVQIVPSGVLAVNRAQEKGCTYCFAG